MKSTTIHLSLPPGSSKPELHIQISADTLAWLSARAAASGTPITAVAAATLAAQAAAEAAGERDLKIEFCYWQPDARALAATRQDLQALAVRMQSVRTACLSSTPPVEPIAAAAREQRLADLSAALKDVGTLLSTLTSLARANGSQLAAEVVRKALAEAEPSAPATPAPVPAPALPAGVTAAEVETFLQRHAPNARTNRTVWTASALAARALGKQFDIPRPPEPAPKPPAQVATSKPTTTQPAASGAVDKLVAAQAAKPEGAQ